MTDAFVHPLGMAGGHWALRRMRKEKFKPKGYLIRSYTGTVIGLIVRCRTMLRPPDTVDFHDWVILPTRGATPQRAVTGVNAAIQAAARCYADAPQTEQARRAYRESKAVSKVADQS